MRTSTVLCALVLFAGVLTATANNQLEGSKPGLTTKDGHVLLSSGGLVANLTDSVSASKVKSLFDASDEQVASVQKEVVSVERRADGNLGDLVKKLATSYEENTKAVTSMSSGIVAALGRIHDIVNLTAVDGSASEMTLTIQQHGEGDKARTTGLPWNPMAALRLARPLSDLGGDVVRVFFPVGRELVAEDSYKAYQCKFTYIDAKGKVDAKSFRWSAPVAAKHARAFECITPPWGKGGSLPPVAKWKTAFAVYENEREMPAPKGGAVFNWLPNTPSIKVGQATLALLGPAEGKSFTHPLTIDYPYGSEGYKDVRIKTTSSNTKELTGIKIAAADIGAAGRVMTFVIKKTDKAKTATYKITIEATSSKTGLKSSSVLTIAWKVQPPALGKGGSDNVFSSAALEFIHKKVGVGSAESWELCFSRAKHGWKANAFRNNCLNKGPLFFFQKRGKNNYIFGGNAHVNAVDRNNGYIHTSNTEAKAWLFSIKPSSPNKVEIAKKCTRSNAYYYDNTNYLMCFGGGHDMCCRYYDGYCWNNLGHDYCPATGGGYSSNAWRSWAGGQYSWNGKAENDVYEVYVVK